MPERYTISLTNIRPRKHSIQDAKAGGAAIATVATLHLAFARELVRLANRGDKSETAVAEFWVEEDRKENMNESNPVP